MPELACQSTQVIARVEAGWVLPHTKENKFHDAVQYHPSHNRVVEISNKFELNKNEQQMLINLFFYVAFIYISDNTTDKLYRTIIHENECEES